MLCRYNNVTYKVAASPAGFYFYIEHCAGIEHRTEIILLRLPTDGTGSIPLKQELSGMSVMNANKLTSILDNFLKLEPNISTATRFVFKDNISNMKLLSLVELKVTHPT